MIRLIAFITASAAGLAWGQAATDALAGQAWRAAAVAVLGGGCCAVAMRCDRRCNPRRAAGPRSAVTGQKRRPA